MLAEQTDKQYAIKYLNSPRNHIQRVTVEQTEKQYPIKYLVNIQQCVSRGN